jgi:SAM-dependent methyltransferase
MADDHVARTVAVYDHIAGIYAAKAEGTGPVVERESFAAMVPQGGSILDAGCGSGRDSRYFSERGFAVTGVDLSDALLAIARKNAPRAVFLKRDLRHPDFADGSFAGIWACASVLHLRYGEASSVLASFTRMLTPGGILFLYLKTGEGEHETVEPSVPGASRFFAYYSEDRLRRLIEETGLAVTDIHTNESRSFPGKWWLACFARKGETA